MVQIPAPEGITCPDWDLKYVGKKDCRYYKQGGGCEHPDHLVCVEWLKKQKPYEPPPDVQASLEIAKKEIAAHETTIAAPVSVLDALAPPPAPDGPPKAGEAFRLAIAPGPPPKPGRLRAHPDAVAIEAPTPTTLHTPSSSLHVDAPGSTLHVDAPLSAFGSARAARSAAEMVAVATDSYTPPLKAIDEAEITRLEELAKEITIASDAGEIVLVSEHTSQVYERNELTFREAAFLRLVVDAFPGARVTKVTGAPPPKGVVSIEVPAKSELETKLEQSIAEAKEKKAAAEGWDD